VGGVRRAPGNVSGTKRSGSAGFAAVLGAASLFSWGFILVKAAGLPPATTAVWRLLLALLVLLAAAGVTGARWPRLTRTVGLAGVGFGAHQLLYMAASQTTSIAVVTLVTALQPLLVAVVSHRTVGEAVPKRLIGWALVALLGVAVVVVANLGAKSRSLSGDLLSVVNLFAFTAYFLFAKRAREGGAPTLTLTAQIAAVALAVVAPALLLVDTWAPERSDQWLLVAVLALGPGNAHLLLNWAHRRVSAALASLTLSAVPLLASVWAHLVFDEPYGIRHVLGMLLVAVAIEGGRRAERDVARGQAGIASRTTESALR